MIRAVMSNSSITSPYSTSITPEQARDARVRALAYVFSCWHAKQKDIPPQTAGDHPNDSAAKEVSHVEHPSDDASSIVHHPFTKENE
jgi:hypothetical protein